MNTSRERILLVESDPLVSDLIARQTLQPLGYRIIQTGTASGAIQEAARTPPDVILSSLNLPDLSGKDLLVALTSQGIDVPVIVIAPRGMEADVIQTFRLGASDYLASPLREAEVVAAVERVLKQVRARKEKEALARQLNQTNQELQRMVRELTTIFALGKAVTSITDQRILLEKILEGAVYVTEADCGWLLLKEDQGKRFILSAGRNLPKSELERIGQPWDDGLSSLVALSGESLSIYGDPLKRFKISALGQSALVVPVKAKKEVIGLIVVLRKAAQPFSAAGQKLLEAVADYASISLLNASLFKALEERARSFQQAAELSQASDRINEDILKNARGELAPGLLIIQSQLQSLANESLGPLTPEARAAVAAAREKVNYLLGGVDTLTHSGLGSGTYQRQTIDLVEVINKATGRYKKLADQHGVSICLRLPSTPVPVAASPSQLTKAFEGLLSQAIRLSPRGSSLDVRLDPVQEGKLHWAQALIRPTGEAVEKRLPEPSPESLKGGFGASINLVKEIITAYGGKAYIQSEPGKGLWFGMRLPAAEGKPG